MKSSYADEKEAIASDAITLTQEMIEVGALAAWHNPIPPEIAKLIVERAYRAMEAVRIKRASGRRQ